MNALTQARRLGAPARREPPLVALGPDSIDRVTPFAPFPAMEREALAMDACRKLVLAALRMARPQPASATGTRSWKPTARRWPLGMVGNDEGTVREQSAIKTSATAEKRGCTKTDAEIDAMFWLRGWQVANEAGA